MSPAFSSNFLLSSSRMIKQALAQYALSRDLRFIALQKNVLEVSLIEQWQTIITHSNNDAHKNVSLSAMPAQLYEKLTCCNVLWLLYNKTFNNHYFHAWTCYLLSGNQMTVQYKIRLRNYTAFRKKTPSRFLSYLRKKCWDLHKSFRKCLGGNIYSTSEKLGNLCYLWRHFSVLVNCGFYRWRTGFLTNVCESARVRTSKFLEDASLQYTDNWILMQ